MTMTYCRTCNNDVHITHKASDCPACGPGEKPSLKTPPGLRE